MKNEKNAHDPPNKTRTFVSAKVKEESVDTNVETKKEGGNPEVEVRDRCHHPEKVKKVKPDPDENEACLHPESNNAWEGVPHAVNKSHGTIPILP